MRKQTLENGCEIYHADGLEIGMMQTEIPGKPEAWLFWVESQGSTTARDWREGTRDDAITAICTWLGPDPAGASFLIAATEE